MEQAKVIRSAFKVGGLTLASRVLGLVRDFLNAGFFGTSLAMSAFVVAFRVPNFFRSLFGEGALSAAFIPVFVEARQKEGDAAAWLLARRVISFVAVVLTVLVIAGIAAAGFLRTCSGLGPKATLILPLTQIMLPYLIFICVAAVSMAILYSYHEFGIAAVTYLQLNIVLILFNIFVCPLFGDTPEKQIHGLAWGVFVAGVLQLAYQLPFMKRHGYRPGFEINLRDTRVVRVFGLMAPAALGTAVTQVNVLVNSLLAAWIGAWAPAALYFSERLLYFPQGILATAMGQVLLPILSKHAADAKPEEMRATINHALRTLLFAMAPAAVGLLVLARPITSMIFQWGEFSDESVTLTARALAFYAPGLFVFCLAKVFVPTFYSLKDAKTPVKIGLVSVALNFSLNVLFILTLPTYWKHAGLALATVISEGFNGLTLGVLLTRRLGSPGWPDVFACVGRALIACAAMTLVLVAVPPLLDPLLARVPLPAKAQQIAVVMTTIAAGAATYFMAAAALRAPELEFVKDALRRRRNPRTM